ncbi:hypothetical protein D3C71_997630 [compost metagenome]
MAIDTTAPMAWKQATITTRVVSRASSGTQLGTGMASLTSFKRTARSFQTSSPE